MVCKKCGNEIADDTAFCPKCGACQKEVVEATKTGNPMKGIWNSFKKTIISFYDWVTKGRVSRKTFWSFELFFCIALIICSVIDYLLFYSITTPLTDTFSVVFYMLEIKLWCGRIHDTGKPWGYIFIPIYDLVLLFLPSNEGENKYGEMD